MRTGEAADPDPASRAEAHDLVVGEELPVAVLDATRGSGESVREPARGRLDVVKDGRVSRDRPEVSFRAGQAADVPVGPRDDPAHNTRERGLARADGADDLHE